MNIRREQKRDGSDNDNSRDGEQRQVQYEALKMKSCPFAMRKKVNTINVK